MEEVVPGKAATCTETGLTDGVKCSVCGEVIAKQTTIPTIPHTYDDKYDDTCNICGFVRDAECAHTNTEKVLGKAATCTSAGLTDGKKCSDCGETLTAQVAIPKKNHTESDWIVDAAATCTESGSRHTECTDCHVQISSGTISKTGHTGSDWIVDKEATKEEDGEKHIECTVCQAKIWTETIPATGSIGLAYTVNSDNSTCTITGMGECTDEHVVIPKIKDGYRVTAIATRAFYNCTTITAVTIPSTVTSIGTQIFYKATNLTTVYYNSSYSPKDNPFLNTPSISKVVFGESKIPSSILDNCANIEEVEIKNSVKSIGDSAFYECTSLKNVYYQGSLEDWCKIKFDSYNSNPC